MPVAEFNHKAKEMIKRISNLYGCSSFPTKDQFDASVSFIYDTYHHYTIEEIYKAAELNLAGLYSEKIQVYGSVTTVFITDVLNKFTRFRTDAHKKLMQHVHSLKTEFQSSDKAGYRNQDYFDKFINYTNASGRYPAFWNWTAMFKHIEENNMFFDEPAVREKFRSEIERGVKNMMRKNMLLERDELKAGFIGSMIQNPNYGKNDFYEAYVIMWMDQSGLIREEIVKSDR